MSYSKPLILQVHLSGAEPYELGDEIWQQSLPDAIRAEAEIVAYHARSDLLGLPNQAGRVALRDRVIAEMTAALRQPGDTYTAPDGVGYTLTYQTQHDLPSRDVTLAVKSPQRQRRSSRKCSALRISRSDHPPPAPPSCAGATAPKAKPWPGIAMRSSSAKAIMGTLGLYHVG
jgi:hypothetical protein